MIFAFNLRLFIYLCLGFILATVIGTVSHEAGHYIAAKHYGYPAEMHYVMVSTNSIAKDDKRLITFDSLYKANKQKILAKESSPEKVYFLRYRDSLRKILESDRQFKAQRNQREKEHFVFTLCGPLQTILTGTIGFICLFVYRNKPGIQALSFKHWSFVFLTFFWSRQVFNFGMFVLDYLITGHISYRGDEVKLSYYLNMPIWAVGLITGITGALLMAWTFFKIIPKQQRLTFVLSGIAGSLAGWYLWMDISGPVMLH